MDFKVRMASRKDKEEMLNLYTSFTKHFVGSASRATESYTRMLRKKDHINYVALDNQNRIVGYIHTTLEKRNNTGEFVEIIVDPKHDFEQVASLLVEEVSADFAKKKVAAIVAGSLRNPAYQKVFPKLGFMESESTGVFMYAILDAQKLLNELEPVFAGRLKGAERWKGLTQIQCDEHSLFLERTTESVRQVIWTNRPVDFKIKLSGKILVKLIFGVVDPLECRRNGQLEVETAIGKAKANQLLQRLFPRSQFLTMDFW